MSVSDLNINFRAPERTHSRAKDLMKLFERGRSWVMREAVDVFWTLMFDTEKLLPFIDEWQAFNRKNGQQPVAQMKLHFPLNRETAFFPKFGGHNAA